MDERDRLRGAARSASVGTGAGLRMPTAATTPAATHETPAAIAAIRKPWASGTGWRYARSGDTAQRGKHGHRDQPADPGDVVVDRRRQYRACSAGTERERRGGEWCDGGREAEPEDEDGWQDPGEVGRVEPTT